MTLSDATSVLEHAMDPDNYRKSPLSSLIWTFSLTVSITELGSPPSRLILELSSTHSSLSSSLSSLSTFFKDLPISTCMFLSVFFSPEPHSDHVRNVGNPPLLSPEDVKSVAHSWRTLDDKSQSAALIVDEWSERLIDHSIKCKFFSRKEAGEMFGFDDEEEGEGMEVD